MPSSSFRRSTILMNVVGVLAALDRKSYVPLLGGVGCILNPTTIFGADLVVTTRQRMRAAPPDGFLSGGPVLAVEVVSPSNTAAALNLKVSYYMAAGTQEMWLIYPDTCRVHVYPDGARDRGIFEKSERFSSVLGCEFEVAKLFER